MWIHGQLRMLRSWWVFEDHRVSLSLVVSNRWSNCQKCLRLCVQVYALVRVIVRLCVWGRVNEQWTALSWWGWFQTNDPIVRSVASAINPLHCTTKNSILCRLCYLKIYLFLYSVHSLILVELGSSLPSKCQVWPKKGPAKKSGTSSLEPSRFDVNVLLLGVNELSEYNIVKNEVLDEEWQIVSDSLDWTRKTWAEEDDTGAVCGY